MEQQDNIPAEKEEKPDFETGVTLQAKIDFYRNETSKLRNYLEVNRIGKPTQGLFDALYDHVNELQQEITTLRASEAYLLKQVAEKNAYIIELEKKQ